MKGQFCPICNEPALADSVFCNRHRAQASLFASAFAPPPDAAPAARPVKESPELMPLRATLGDVLAKLMERSQSGDIDARRRAPELVVYYLREELCGRVYFASAPATSDASAGFVLHGESVKAALAPDGVVGQALARAYLERLPKLRSGALAAIGLDFLSHADSIVLAERPTPDEKVEIARFVRKDDAFVRQAA